LNVAIPSVTIAAASTELVSTPAKPAAAAAAAAAEE
jgi:hypothetical protein